MPLDTSIENVGEYYSSHYLESTFAKDTRELLRRWKDEGSGAVSRRIQRLGRQFFRAKEQALEIDEPRRRLKSRRDALRSWHGLFLEALGYTTLRPLGGNEGGATAARGLPGRRRRPFRPRHRTPGTFRTALAGGLRDRLLPARRRPARRCAEREPVRPPAPAVPARLLADGRTEITAEDLRREALNFVYRLIFCFYAESHGGELGILPIDDDAYRLGYSLESVRDLEQVPLTPATEAGT